ncbi:MAG: hypothetical protein HZB80_07720, partial [Deltaproteobacteria bacterium]|nr:hypothetical protein [Deltaproteobacteria bacterium]
MAFLSVKWICMLKNDQSSLIKIQPNRYVLYFKKIYFLLALTASIIITVSPSVAGGGDFIDQRVNKDDSGIWQYHYDLPAYLIGATAAGAIWEGNDTRFGK